MKPTNSSPILLIIASVVLLCSIAFLVYALFFTNKEPKAIINGTPFLLEIAETDEEKNKGLSNRTKESFPENYGMLFTYVDDKQIPEFWMKDMLFPIDIIWIDDGVVIDVDTNIPVPEPNTPDNQLELYSPNEPVSMVLEVHSGVVEQLGGWEALLNKKITFKNLPTDE